MAGHGNVFKLAVFLEGQWIFFILQRPAPKGGIELLGEHIGIAPGDEDVLAVVFGQAHHEELPPFDSLDFVEEEVNVFDGDIREHLHIGLQDGVEVRGLHPFEAFIVKADPDDLTGDDASLEEALDAQFHQCGFSAPTYPYCGDYLLGIYGKFNFARVIGNRNFLLF